MREVQIITGAFSGRHPPESPVPAPRGTNANRAPIERAQHGADLRGDARQHQQLGRAAWRWSIRRIRRP